jgi:hypothetical protein
VTEPELTEQAHLAEMERYERCMEEWRSQHEQEKEMLARWKSVIGRLNAALDRFEAVVPMSVNVVIDPKKVSAAGHPWWERKNLDALNTEGRE